MADDITLDAPETRLERFLAAAAGMDGITLDEPVTRIEKYLYMIAQGSGGVPAVEDADKGKYLHANESTGDLEWATAGGGTGGGVLVVTDTDGTLDKTFKEINDAYKSGVMPVVLYNGMLYYLQSPPDEEYFGLTTYAFLLNSDGNQNYYLSGRYYTAESANDYPVYDP